MYETYAPFDPSLGPSVCFCMICIVSRTTVMPADIRPLVAARRTNSSAGRPARPRPRHGSYPIRGLGLRGAEWSELRPSRTMTPDTYMSEQNRKFRRNKFDAFPAVHMSYMSQNFRLFHALDLSVQNFLFFFAHVSGVNVVSRPRRLEMKSLSGS